MALAATADVRQALLPRVVRGKTGGNPVVRAVPQPGGEHAWSDFATRLPALPAAAVSLPSRSGSTPDLLDAAGHPPATFVRAPSGLPAVAFRPGNARGIPRRTAIPLFVQSC